MTRRILVALITLIVAVVAGAMVPLAVNTASHDRTSFNQETEDQAKTWAAVYQTVLAGGKNAALPSLLNQVGSGLVVLPNPPYGVQSATHGKPTLAADALAYQMMQHDNSGQVRVVTTPQSVTAAVAVIKNGDVPGPVAGVVLVTNSSAPLNQEIRTIWTILIAIGVAGLLAAALIAVWLARWVSKPLAGLDTAARRLADGDLTVRAKPDYGPPEVRRLARTFNTMAGRLENLVHGSRAVLADVSHQLRTPLAALRLRLDFLAAEAAETDPEMAAELNGAQDEVTRLSRLVDGLLAVARAENVQPQPKVIDVAEVAEERVAAWLPVAEDRGIFLSSAYLEPVPGWLGEGHLEQVLDNLIDNALEALSAGDRIEVSASHSETGVRIKVRDNGPGMSPEMRERAFTRFSSDSPGGTGIGLAIVQRLVTANGGTVDLEDSPGGGLTVLLDFPGAPSQVDDDAADLPTVGNAKISR
ncbi:MAG TPA: HAMP domain-containing sensor histidine kinase [Streptosporangiaceae bacterium]|jgi:signal transduction histidine kinase